jgi:hypothetical protein
MSASTLHDEVMECLIVLLGPSAAGAETRPLTAQERADVERGLARYHGDVAAAAGVNVPEDVAGRLQRLGVGGPR